MTAQPLIDLIDPRPRQLERYAEDFNRLADEHRQVTEELARIGIDCQRADQLQWQLETLQHGLAEPVARLEIIARMLLSRTGGDSMNRDLAAAVFETSNVLQTLLAQTCPSPTSLPHGEQND
jgi:hypothetical protein